MDDIKTEMLEGIECLVLEVSNGDSIYFKKTLKGKDFRYLKALSSKTVKFDMEKVQDVDSTDQEAIKDIDLPEYFDGMLNMFPILAVKVKKADGSFIAPTMDYFDNLDYDDAETAFNFVQFISKSNKKK